MSALEVNAIFGGAIVVSFVAASVVLLVVFLTDPSKRTNCFPNGR